MCFFLAFCLPRFGSFGYGARREASKDSINSNSELYPPQGRNQKERDCWVRARIGKAPVSVLGSVGRRRGSSLEPRPQKRASYFSKYRSYSAQGNSGGNRSCRIKEGGGRGLGRKKLNNSLPLKENKTEKW